MKPFDTQRRDTGNPTAEIQSDLSDLYRLNGNLPKAEELARNAAESAQSAGYIPRIPPALHALAQVQISQHKYDEADRTYDRAAMIQDMMIGNADTTLGKTALIKAASDLYATRGNELRSSWVSRLSRCGTGWPVESSR